METVVGLQELRERVDVEEPCVVQYPRLLFRTVCASP